MKLLIYLLPYLLICGCSGAFFEEMQPKNGKELTEFPSKMRGKWSMDKDIVEITSSELIYRNENDKLVYSLNSDTTRLMEAANSYFVNIYESQVNYWSIVYILPQKNGDIFISLLESDQVEGYSGLKEKEGDFSALSSTDDNPNTIFASPILYEGVIDAKSFAKHFLSLRKYVILKKNGTIESSEEN